VLSPSSPGLTRAALVLFDPPSTTANRPGAVRHRIPLQFNPERISLSKAATWQRSPANRAAAAAMPEFRGATPRVLSLDVFLDATFSLRNTVEEQVEMLLSCCVPTDGSVRADRPSPPWVRLEWGRGRSTSFNACVTSVQANYTLFGGDGAPKRATCTITLEEIGGSTPRQNPTSGSPEVQIARRLQAGDSLASLAWQQFGDATRWRVIAQANNITDPERVPPGTVLIVPPLPELQAGIAGPPSTGSSSAAPSSTAPQGSA
jgi:nucleoid-associated protein YgaU